MRSESVFIGLGSNLGASQQLLQDALVAMADLPNTELLQTSSFYSSAPMGVPDQPRYLNAVCQLHTALAPLDLLHALQAIELEHGRVREGERWGPRTLDLDILLYGNESIETDELTIPHYGMAQREFVLVPLFEIAPELLMPDGHPLAKWVSQCTLDGLKRLRTSNQD